MSGVLDTRDGANAADGATYDVIIVRGTDPVDELRAHLAAGGVLVVDRGEYDDLHREAVYLRVRAAASVRGAGRPAYVRLYSRAVIAVGRRLPQPLKNLIKKVWSPWPPRHSVTGIPSTAPAIDARESTTYDIVCFSSIDRSFRWQRPQQLMSKLAEVGHRVFFIKTSGLLPPGPRTFEATPLRENVWEIALAPPEPIDVYGGDIPAATAAWLPRMLDDLRRELGIISAVSIVQIATWRRVAEEARARLGWMLVYDCMDEWKSFPGMSGAIAREEERLVDQADLVTVSGARLVAKWKHRNRNVVLMRNAADFDYASTPMPELADTLRTAIRDAHAKVSIIVVTYFNRELTRLCLDAVFRTTLHPNVEVIVVDNASTDGTPEMLEELARQHDNLRVILNRTNLGFAAANNQGLRVATGEVFVLLNNDTVPARGWLPRMFRHLRDPEIGLVVAVTNFSGNESRIAVPYTTLDDMPAFAEEYARANAGKVFDIHVAAMYCAGMRRDAYEVIGPLDEEFTVGMFEDDDYSHRARLAGLRVVCAEDVFVHHFGQASFGKLPKGEYDAIWRRNRAYYERKWGIPWKPHTGR